MIHTLTESSPEGRVDSERAPAPSASEITTVCFRVTRGCNLRCSYCQAPPNGRQLSRNDLLKALKSFCDVGTRRIKFTGGEPFIHPDLLWLVENCHGYGMEATIITNGTILTPAAISVLSRTNSRIKISLHGPKQRHDALQGAAVFDSIVANMRRFVSAGIHTSIHTLLYRSRDFDIRGWIELLATEGIRKVSFMTFVPRGRGKKFELEWSFTPAELDALSAEIAVLAEAYKDSIVVRFLDFARRPYLVFETDGSLVWEAADERDDFRPLQLLDTVVSLPPV